MLERLAELEDRYEELSRLLTDRKILESPERYRDTAREHFELHGIVEEYRYYLSLLEQTAVTESLFNDGSDPEILERRYPVLLREFSIRKNSGGSGKYIGGTLDLKEEEKRHCF